MKCMNLICLLLLTSSAIAMEKDPNDGDVRILTHNYESLDFSDAKLFQDIAKERLRLVEESIRYAYFLPTEEIVTDLLSSIKKRKITKEYADVIAKSVLNLCTRTLSIEYPKDLDSSDYNDCQSLTYANGNFIITTVPSHSKKESIKLTLKFQDNIQDNFKEVTKYINQNCLFSLPVAVEAAELIEKGLGKVTINQALNFIKEYVAGSIESINLLNNPNVATYEKHDPIKNIVSDMYWPINILKTKLSKELNEKEVVIAIKEILKFPSKVIRDLILNPYSTPLNENNIVEEVEKMKNYIPYEQTKKQTSFKYTGNKEVITAMISFLYNKGMLNVSLKNDLNIEDLPKNCNTVLCYYDDIIKGNKDNSTVYGIDFSSLHDEENRLKKFEDLEIEEKPLQKEEPPKYEEKIIKEEYNQEKIVAKYSKYNHEYSNKKAESKSFGLLIGEKAKRQIDAMNGTNAENYINKILLEIKDAVPSLVKGDKVGATAGNFEKLHGISNMWEFRITDSKFSGEIGLNPQSRILFSIQKDTCCILYIGDHPTSTGYKIIEEQNKELLKFFSSN